MQTPNEMFWETVKDWKTRQSLIRVVCSQQPSEIRVQGRISDVSGLSITFLETNTNEEVIMNLEGAEFRHHPFDLVEAKCAFAAIWDDETLSGSCVFTESLEFLN